MKIFNKIKYLINFFAVPAKLLRNHDVSRGMAAALMLCMMMIAATAQAQVAFRSATQSAAAGAITTTITHVGAGADDSRNNCGNITPTIVAGSVGDVLVAVVNSMESSATVSMAGWNTLYQATYPGQDFVARIYWRRATSAAANGDPRTITQSGTCNSIAGQIARFSGVDAVQPFESNPIPNGNVVLQNSGNIDTGTQNTTVNGSMLLVASMLNDNRTVAAGAGWIESFDSSLNLTRDLGLALAYQLQTTAAAGNSISNWDLSGGGSDENFGIIFALRPAVTAANNNLVINVPAGTTTDDVMIASVAAGPCSATNGGACTVTISAPAGWTQIGATIDQTGGGDFGNRLAVYQRVATGAEPASYTWTIGGVPAHGGAVGGIMTFSGVDTATPIDAQLGQATASGAAHQANGITTTVADAMLVGSFSVNSAATWSAPAGMTEQVDVASLATPNDLGISLEMAYEAWAAIGATGARAATASTPPTNDTGTTYLLALRPRIVPTLVSATLVCGTTTQVEVVFSTAVSAVTAQNPANYALDGGASVISAALGADNRVVTLTTSPLVSGRNYTLTVNNVATPGGGVIAADSQITFFSEGGYLSGLQGSYFANMTLTGTAAGVRIDGPVDFDWGNGAPGVGGIGADNFSVRWTGFVMPTISGDYTFRTRSDDGVRLYIDGNLVIDNWTDHAPTDNDSIAIALTAGQRHALTMEFYENGGGAVAQLSWNGPGTGGFQFVPRSALSHFCGAPAPRAFFQLDEVAWNAAGDVVDATGNGFNGTAVGGTTPVPAQVCNGAQLDGTGRYITVPGLSGLLNATASLAFWIRTTQAGNDLGWQAPGVSGVELSGGADDIFWGWLDAGGRIGVSVGNDYSTKSATTINNGAWRHVVLTRDHNAGTYKIYIDGALDAQGAITGGVIGTAFSSLGRIEDTGGTPVYLDGELDEIRIYDQVLSDAQVLTIRDITRPCISLLDHIRIEHNGLGLTCEPATVTVRACADATCSTPYTGNVTTTLAPTGWVGGDTINFTSPSGSTTAQLRRTTAGVVALDAGTTAPAPANPTQCYNGLTATCSFEFRDTGFLFSAVPAQVAGTTSATHTLQAVRTDNSTGACTGLFTGAVPNIELASECVNPAACQPGQAVTFNNNGSGTIAANNGGAVSSWTTRTLVFGADSTADFTFSYPDVGAMRLHARYNIDGSGDYMTGSTPGPYFVVKPAGFTVTGIERTADGFANPGAADASGAVFIKAGEPITLTVTAVNSSGQKTPNYGKETPAQGVQLTAALVGGLGLTANPVLGNGTIPGSAFGNGADTGIATVDNVTWDEVGIITITPSVSGSDYLGAGDVTGTATGNIGRFTPHHFDVSPGAPMFATACIAGGHTYIGQVFDYAAGLVPELAVTARASGGALTANYKGAFFKITNTRLAQAPYDTQAGRYARFDALGGGNTPALDVSGLPATVTDPAVTDNNNGTATLTFSGGSGLAFDRTSPAAPFDADISLAINVVDTDDVAYASNPASFGADAAGAGIAFSGGKEMRFGRLRLGAASGSQLLPLQLPLEAQYWGGTFWLTNADDSCTTLSPANIGLGNPVGNLALGETAVSAVTSPLSAGRGTVTLSAPGAGNNGSVDVAVNLGSGPNADACPAFAPAATGANMPYLHGQWCGATTTRDPSARARFGIRGGGSETIYRRESFN